MRLPIAADDSARWIAGLLDYSGKKYLMLDTIQASVRVMYLQSDIRTVLLRVYLCSALSAMIFLLSGCDRSSEPKPLNNRVYLPEGLEAYGGQTFAVPILFENEDELSAINVPLLFPSHIMRFDSISFRESRVNGFGLKVAYLFGDTILIGALGVTKDTVTVNKGRGLLTTLYFWMHGNAPETTFVFNTCDSWKQPLSFFDAHFQRLPTPEFVAGRVHVTGITWPSPLEPGESQIPKGE